MMSTTTASVPTTRASGTRPSAWNRDILQLARLLRTYLATMAAPQRSVWWGAGYSELMLHALPALPALNAPEQTVVADSDARLTRRACNWAGANAQERHLLALGDLRLDRAGLEAQLKRHAAHDAAGYLALQDSLAQHSQRTPCQADGSADLLVADFVLNRIPVDEWQPALAEAMRVLQREGRFFCALLVSDEALPQASSVRAAPSGRPLQLPHEKVVLQALQDAGFHGLVQHWPDNRHPAALDRIGDAEVRMLLVQASKGKQGPCLELGQAVVYRGPWRQVSDDDGHVYPRGERVAVCAKTYDLLMRKPYSGAFMGLRRAHEPELQDAALFDCNTPALRDPRVTKGLQPFAGAAPAGAGACAPDSGCC